MTPHHKRILEKCEQDRTIKPILGFPGYFASNLGEIFSAKREKRLKRLSPSKIAKNYFRIGLSLNGKTKTMYVHQLVLLAFNGACPPQCQCAHLNGVPWDNRIENLIYASRLENASHKHKHGTQPKGQWHERARLSDADVKYIRENIKLGPRGKSNTKELALKFKISRQSVREIACGKSWKHIEGSKPKLKDFKSILNKLIGGESE